MNSATPNDGPRRSYYVVIEGPIGVGKTTLVERLSERLRSRTVLEVFEENPFLPDFYRDRERYAFHTEMYFLLARYRQMEALAQPDLFAPYTLSDYLFTKSRLFARETLQEHEFQLFDHMFQILDQSVPQPDLVIYLTAPVPVLLDRIQHRGRPYEKEIEPGYLESLLALYEEEFSRNESLRVVTVDTTDLNFATSPAAIDLILQALHSPPKRRTFLRGPVQEGLPGL